MKSQSSYGHLMFSLSISSSCQEIEYQGMGKGIVTFHTECKNWGLGITLQQFPNKAKKMQLRCTFYYKKATSFFLFLFFFFECNIEPIFITDAVYTYSEWNFVCGIFMLNEAAIRSENHSTFRTVPLWG